MNRALKNKQTLLNKKDAMVEKLSMLIYQELDFKNVLKTPEDCHELIFKHYIFYKIKSKIEGVYNHSLNSALDEEIIRDQFEWLDKKIIEEKKKIKNYIYKEYEKEFSNGVQENSTIWEEIAQLGKEPRTREIQKKINKLFEELILNDQLECLTF